jgi:hypothetical protein
MPLSRMRSMTSSKLAVGRFKGVPSEMAQPHDRNPGIPHHAHVAAPGFRSGVVGW